MNRILIIGASSGIGASVARILQEANVEVIAVGRNEEALKEHKKFIVGDVTSWATDSSSIPMIEPVNAIIWCAGICELAAGQMLSLKTVRRTLSVNLEAPLVVLSHFYRKRIIKDGGKIILLGSQAAHDAGEGFSVYAASKGGLASAARILNKEFSRRGVSVKCIEPGTVNTPMTQRLIEQFGHLKDGHMENMIEPEEVAEQIMELLKD